MGLVPSKYKAPPRNMNVKAMRAWKARNPLYIRISSIQHYYDRFLKDLTYDNQPNDILHYKGCMWFEDSEAFKKLEELPCYAIRFKAKDVDLHDKLQAHLEKAKNELGYLDGPVSVLMYRDYSSLGNSEAWFLRHQNNNPKGQLRAIELSVVVMFPSLTKEGKAITTLAEIGKSHRLVSDLLYLPQNTPMAYGNTHHKQCQSFCKDKNGKFFPCGCIWDGQCKIEIENHLKRTMFLAAYMLNMEHPDISPLFENAENRSYRLDILPMGIYQYNNCRYALISQNKQYVFNVQRSGCKVYRNTSFNADFREVCAKGEYEKFIRENCTDENEMCKYMDFIADSNFKYAVLPNNGWTTYYTIRYKDYAPRGFLYLVLDDMRVEVLSEQGQKQLWEMLFVSVPKENRVKPLALVLSNDGELLIYNGDNKLITDSSSSLSSLTKTAANFDVKTGKAVVPKSPIGSKSYINTSKKLDKQAKERKQKLDALRKQQSKDEKQMIANISGYRSSKNEDVCPSPPFSFLN